MCICGNNLGFEFSTWSILYSWESSKGMFERNLDVASSLSFRYREIVCTLYSGVQTIYKLNMPPGKKIRKLPSKSADMIRSAKKIC